MDKVKKNMRIRRKIAERGLTGYEVAERLDMSSGDFSKMLKRELAKKEQDEIIRLIESM